MKTYGGMDVQLHAFLASALDVGEWSDSRTDRFTPRERAAGTRWIGGWVGHTTPTSLNLSSVFWRKEGPYKTQVHTKLIKVHRFYLNRFFGKVYVQ